MKDFSNNIFSWLKNNLVNVLVGVVLLAGIGLRLSLYGDMRFFE